MSIQTKLIAGLGVVVLALLACLASYHYGHTVGEEAERLVWQTKEVGRVTNVAVATMANTKQVLGEVAQDNEIERKSNADYEQALAKLATAQADNRRLVAANGGLRISAAACTGRTDPAGQTQTAGAGVSSGTDPGTIALPQQVDADLQDLADEADRILERYRALRSWCFDQGYCRLNALEPSS